MGEIDRQTMAAGTPGVQLMENAGRQVFGVISEEWEDLQDLCVTIVCGRGNNGGDGFVVARLLSQSGAEPRVFLTAEEETVRGDAAEHLERLKAAGVAVETLLGQDSLEPLERALEGADLVVDALLGTGLKGPPRPEAARVIECVMQADRPVVAVDLPSGLEADTGQVHGSCVHAVLTVTFGLPKTGHLFFPGRAYCGILRLTDIGLASEAIQRCPSRTLLLTEERMAECIPLRPEDAHKGTCGSVVVVAGSVGMTGAAALTADAALLAGAGRVTLGVPASLNDILEAKLTEVMTWPLPEVGKRRCLALRGLGEIERLLDGADCLALGPGVGRYRETVELVRRLVPRVELPMVLDADGLFALAGAVELLSERTAPTVLTPHLGEFARLTGLDAVQIAKAPLECARQFAQEYQVTLVLKGAPTVIGLADGRRLVNPTGNPGMATAGSGDVLTGLITGLLAQGLEPEMAACLGVYLHGRAGDLARDKLGEWGMKAGDIGQMLPQATLETLERGGHEPLEPGKT